MDKEYFFRETFEISLLKKEEKNSLRIISSHLDRYIMDNNDYFKRCLSRVEDGKIELRKKLEDVRKIIFNQEDLIYWFHKMKKDAISETDLIFIKFNASIGAEEKDIDFENAGFFAGVY